MKRIIIFLLLAINITCYSQFPRVDIPGSQIRTLTSSIVKGQEYELQILLPGGYSNSAKKYPVVYLMDSQWDFPLVKSTYGQQYYDGFIPEIILVGVTWGGFNPNPDSLRARDYTPTKENRLPQSGGADQFLSFMKDELFPFIETNYRADNKNRTLMGCSLGGLITLYALFTHTEMFTGYVAASPAIGWDREIIYQYEKKFDEKRYPSARVYMTIGGVERSVPAFEKLSSYIVQRNYSNVKVKAKVLENTGHSGTKSETFGRGLQYVFERSSISLSESTLNKYAGKYQLPNGNRIEVRKEDNQLFLYYSETNKYTLYASSETDLYSNSEFLNIHFKINDDIVEGFQLDRYGSTQFITKSK